MFSPKKNKPKHIYNDGFGFGQNLGPCSICEKLYKDPIHWSNGGTICDVDSGFCACGAHHEKDDPRVMSSCRNSLDKNS